MVLTDRLSVISPRKLKDVGLKNYAKTSEPVIPQFSLQSTEDFKGKEDYIIQNIKTNSEKLLDKNIVKALNKANANGSTVKQNGNRLNLANSKISAEMNNARTGSSTLLSQSPPMQKTLKIAMPNSNSSSGRKTPRISISPPKEIRKPRVGSEKTSTPISSPICSPGRSPEFSLGRPSTAKSNVKSADVEIRRSSVATSNPSSVQRKSFSRIGRQVSSLLRMKKTFTGVLSKQAMPANGSESNEIHDLPKSPRFSSYLSAEAQFAVMKGYEDVIHNEIATKLPQYRPHLRRTKTPTNKIEIKRTGNSSLRRSTDDDLESISSICSEDESEDDYESSLRRASMPISCSTSFGGYSAPVKLRTRVKSSPTRGAFLPRERRLVLTYRLESAMDILDTLRFQSGGSAISPRVRESPRKILPVKDYNNWTGIWHNEFETSTGSTLKPWKT